VRGKSRGAFWPIPQTFENHDKLSRSFPRFSKTLVQGPPSTFLLYRCANNVQEVATLHMSGTASLLKIEPGLGDHRFSAVIRTAPQSKDRLLRPVASTLVPIRRCPVCFRAACPLKSHRQYAQSRGLDDKKTATNARGSSSGINRSSTEKHLESPEGIQYRLTEISFAKVDCFVNFPLPKGAKAEVHQLFQDCKPTSLSLSGFSFSSAARLSVLSNEDASEAHACDIG
jgi:hypothetical protein